MRAFHVAGREARAILFSPGGAVIVGLFWLVSGSILLTHMDRFFRASIYFQQQSGLQSGRAGAHVNDFVVYPYLGTLIYLLIIVCSLLTMRSFSDERRSGNLELLMSQPLRGADLVLGKYLGTVVGILACFAAFIPHCIALQLLSTPDWGAALTGALGVLLLALLFLAVGILVSILSRSQVEAAVLTFGVCLLLVTIDPVSFSGPASQFYELANFFTILARFDDLARGVFELGHISFFVGSCLIVLALALRSLDLIRWQG